MRGAGEETEAWRYFKRDVVPFAAISPSSTFFHLWKVKKITFSQVSSLLQVFLTWTFGVIGQIAGCKGIEYSSPTLASAMSNLTPAFTFTLAVIFRIEKVVLRSSGTQAKIIGAIVSISGALVIVLYKGPEVLAAASSTSTISLHQNIISVESSWIIGGLLLASQYFLASVWYFLQTRVMEAYPEEITVVFCYNLFATLISAPVCFLAERNLSSWVLKPDIALAAIVYQGVFVSLFSAIIHTWGLHLKGPVYISLFRPLSIAIAVAMGAIFLGDALHLGSVIGAMILCFGFYTAMNFLVRFGSVFWYVPCQIPNRWIRNLHLKRVDERIEILTVGSKPPPGKEYQRSSQNRTYYFDDHRLAGSIKRDRRRQSPLRKPCDCTSMEIAALVLISVEGGIGSFDKSIKFSLLKMKLRLANKSLSWSEDSSDRCCIMR
ncbi:unnamed protein product [Microthlaspi erraticum]|uniref:Uncharacterized protein n=1 Tax=Microthlaspi erraticum TaxID=1685480 RepID=A0A6D2HXV1_9BRAS|nr:unnamed protein product [Microthlaspi erraticum]